MEFIIIILIFVGINWAWNLGTKTIGAAAKTVTSGGSFSANFSKNLQIKIDVLDKEHNFDQDVFGIYVKGNPAVITHDPAIVILKLYDKETSLPILSTFEDVSESNSRVFEHTIQIGDMGGKYWEDWARLSVLIPTGLIGPHKGKRELELKCFLWREFRKPVFVNGFIEAGRESNKGFINAFTHEFSLDLTNSGYMEAGKERLEVQKVSVKLAISIALADGSLDQSEGNAIKNWIRNVVDSSQEAQKTKIKTELNNSLEAGFNERRTDLANIKMLCESIKNIGDIADKYDLLELCLDVMAADGEADKHELKQISEISSFIGIDYEEVTRLKDQRLIKLNPASSSLSGLEEKLGINPDWDKNKLNKQILAQYGKWNGRLNSVAEGTERENAQMMMDLIAEARRKYS